MDWRGKPVIPGLYQFTQDYSPDFDLRRFKLLGNEKVRVTYIERSTGKNLVRKVPVSMLQEEYYWVGESL